MAGLQDAACSLLRQLSLPYLASCVPMANNPHSTTTPSQTAPSLARLETATLQVLHGGHEFADKANVKREKDEQT
ncbi:hypothetical protein NC651_017430 [Populus alba x Populus x berolinensis]|nr:hypothetical protein NC651_017430 [Populus alba x Populus x berolinensis]